MTTLSMIDIDQITSLPNGARFYKCDLHTHTPADNSFNTGEYHVDTDEQKKVFARELVRYVRDVHKLDVLGVTEHNDVSWIPYIQEAAKEVGLIVFPGVELGVLTGKRTIHFLALFNPNTPADNINHKITQIGLSPEQRFYPNNSPRGLDDITIYAFMERIEQYQGITIAAHVTSSCGLFQDKEGEGRIKAYLDKRLQAVEIPGSREKLGIFEREVVNGEKDLYGKKKVACLNHSDGRCLSEGGDNPAKSPASTKRKITSIGSKATYIKMSTPSVEALRQAFLDWESRIRLQSEHAQQHYPRIIGMAIEGGFLKAKDGPANPFLLHFNPNLNSVIGGRGAGKSALLEALRYAFDVSPKTTTNDEQRKNLLKSTLPPGAKITVFYETDDQACYRIERTEGQDPRVFDANANEEKVGLRPKDLLGIGAGDPIEVYGQKEIYEISKDPEYQLRLLDTYIQEALRPLEEQKATLIRQLKTNAQSIMHMEKEVKDAQEKVKELPSIQDKLERMEKQEIVSRLERKKHLEQEKGMLDQAGRAVKSLIKAIENFAKEQEYTISSTLMNETSRAKLPNAALLATQRALLDRIATTFQQQMQDVSNQLHTIWTEGEQARLTWKQEYDQEDQAYQQLLRDNPMASADQYMKLQTQRQNLMSIQQEIDKREQRIAELKKEQQTLLQELSKLYQQIFDVRYQKAQELTRSLGGDVAISVKQAGNREAYESYLKEKLRGANIRGIDKIAQAMLSNGSYATPIDFVAAIRKEQYLTQGQSSDLETIYNISQTGRRSLTNLSNNILYDLETYQVPDKPVITLRVNGQEKPLNALSVGQKCTAILSLILVERNNPLVIDQPEDDLDNRFIFDEIVKTLRKEKERRQFIVATHNANIPVSGDAELIIVLEADESQGWIDCAGSIDEPTIREPVESILEGGREAFRIRQSKYGVA